jgi:hypothetical protein
MARQEFTGGDGQTGETGLQVINKLNANFAELYAAAHARKHAITSSSDHDPAPEEGKGKFLYTDPVTGVITYKSITLDDLPPSSGGGSGLLVNEFKYGEYISLIDQGLLKDTQRCTIISSQLVILYEEADPESYVFDFDDFGGLVLEPFQSYIVEIEAFVDNLVSIAMFDLKLHIAWESSLHTISLIRDIVSANSSGQLRLEPTMEGTLLTLKVTDTSPLAETMGTAKVHIQSYFQNFYVGEAYSSGDEYGSGSGSGEEAY